MRLTYSDQSGRRGQSYSSHWRPAYFFYDSLLFGLSLLTNSQMLTEVFDLSQTTFLMPSAEEIRRSCRELVMHDDDLGAAVSGLVTIILLYTVILSIV